MRHSLILLPLVLLTVVLPCISCGVKGPPLPPIPTIPQQSEAQRQPPIAPKPLPSNTPTQQEESE